MKPFVKWAGGKTQLLPELLKHVPQFDTYYEPFIGGGALFFELQPKKALIADVNGELINCYQAIKDNPEEVMRLLDQFPVEKEFFYDIRSADRSLRHSLVMSIPEWRAARIIYLNKTCFNGLYRVNSKGEFNTPWGDKKPNHTLYERSNIESISNYLNSNRVEMAHLEFWQTLNKVNLGDGSVFIYCDPPYDVLSETSNFTGYSVNGFSRDDQTALKLAVDDQTQCNAKVLVSNADTPFIRNLWKDYEIVTVEAKRNINSKGNKRGAVNEVLIKNY